MVLIFEGVTSNKYFDIFLEFSHVFTFLYGISRNEHTALEICNIIAKIII